MASISSVSQSELARRRRELRHLRRVKIFQAFWQMLAVSTMSGGLLWVTTLPVWVIGEPDRVVIEGNQFLSAQAIRSLLPLSYPQSLLQVRPSVLAQQLESKAPIAKATVIRQLFPPGLTVQVKERYPVAITQEGVPKRQLKPSSTTPASKAIAKATPDKAKTSAAGASTETTEAPKVGLLDENGLWMPLESYTSVEQTLQLPTLKVLGNPDQYRPFWPEVYQALKRSPVKVYEIDWLNPANLILKTELGIVHFGPLTSRFAHQLNALDQMRQLPKHVNPSQIAYIDLKNPDSPSLQMKSANNSRRQKNP